MPRAPMSETPISSAFPYEIQAKVGEGGMGVVYRAIEPALGRTVAIKRLRPELLRGADPELAEDARRRFLREGRAAAALSHPGVATIYRVGEDEAGPYIAMEWLAGESLEALLAAGRLTIAESVRHVAELLDALDAAHAAGVVHRDIKPANLVILRDGRLKVTDFGIARFQGSDLFKTQAGVVLASPRFASPEQMLGDEVDGRSDIFSTGIILYLALTGRPPFDGKDYVELVGALVKDDPAPPRRHNPQVPAALEAVVLRALAKRREDRYPRAAEMAAALRAVALGTGSGALAPSSVAAASAVTKTTPAPGTATTTTTSLSGLPKDVGRLVLQVAAAWPSKALGRQPVAATLERLLERPLHAEPFGGLVQLGRTSLLLHAGRVVAAFDPLSRKTGDELLDSLPPQAEITMYPLPGGLPGAVVPLLATLLGTPKVRHSGLDSSFVNLPALVKKLTGEGFEGILRLQRGDSLAFVLLAAGGAPLTLLGDGWDDVPLDVPWESWIGSLSVQASIEDSGPALLAATLRRELRDTSIRIEPGRPLQVAAPREGWGSRPSPDDDPSFRVLAWALDTLPSFFAERGRAERWKYLAEWLSLARTAQLHHALPRPETSEADFFDLVTFDEKGKALLLASRASGVGPRELGEFVERVTAAKRARSKGGDIGAALLVAPVFEPAALATYRDRRLGDTSGGWGLEETLTRYEGFVRIGPRRGFHLLLVAEKADGFEPILPS